MMNTVVETPIYDAMLGVPAAPIVGLPECANWQVFGELSKLLPEREIDRTPTVRIVRVDPHADRIADVVYYDPYHAWEAFA